MQRNKKKIKKEKQHVQVWNAIEREEQKKKKKKNAKAKIKFINSARNERMNVEWSLVKCPAFLKKECET